MIGSIAATGYASSMQSELTRCPGISEPVRHLLTDNVGGALHMSGQLDRAYSLSESAAAIRYVQDGHARGKVVIAV